MSAGSGRRRRAAAGGVLDDLHPVADEPHDPGRRVGEEPREEVGVGAQVPAAVEHRCAEGQVGQDRVGCGHASQPMRAARHSVARGPQPRLPRRARQRGRSRSGPGERRGAAEHPRPVLRRRVRPGRRAPPLGGAGPAHRRRRRRDGPHGRAARPARAAPALRRARAQGVRRARRGRPCGGLPVPARPPARLRRAAPGSRAGRRARAGDRGAAQHRPRGVRGGRPADLRRRRLPHPPPRRPRPRRRVRPRPDDPARPVGGGARGRLAVAVRAHRHARRPHRRPGARGVHRRRRRLDRRGPGDDRLGGRQGGRPGRRLRGPRGRRPARGGRDRPRGLLARPGRATRRQPPRPRPPGRRARPARGAHARRWPARTSGRSRCSPPSCAGSTTPCTPRTSTTTTSAPR